MFNKLKFKAAIVERGKTVSQMAEELGMNESTLYRKMNGTTEFTRDEIVKVCELLELESPMDIFFA